jgi:hypothetical protein
MTTNYRNNKKTSSNKTKCKEVPFPWESGAYFCFSPDLQACANQLMQKEALFTLSTKMQQPKMTVDDVPLHFKEVASIVELFQTGLGKDQQHKIQFGVVGESKYLYMIIGPFNSTEMREGFLSPAGKRHFMPIQEHEWFNFLMVT